MKTESSVIVTWAREIIIGCPWIEERLQHLKLQEKEEDRRRIGRGTVWDNQKLRGHTVKGLRTENQDELA